MKTIATLAAILALNSCSGLVAGFTGQPTHATPVKRDAPDAKPVNVATADLIQAEVGDEKKVYGLYDVGVVAGWVGEVSRSEK